VRQADISLTFSASKSLWLCSRIFAS